MASELCRLPPPVLGGRCSWLPQLVTKPNDGLTRASRLTQRRPASAADEDWMRGAAVAVAIPTFNQTDRVLCRC